MKILVLNSRIKSIEFDVWEMPSEKNIISAKIEKIGSDHSIFTFGISDSKPTRVLLKTITHEDAFSSAIAILLKEASLNKDEISAIGHRVVHGGTFTDSIVIDETVKKEIYRDIDMAPLHNPYNLKVIEAAQKEFPSVKHVAVFDTAFHATLPEYVYRYPLPERLYHEYKIRRYGFHGPAHKYLVEKTSAIMSRPVSSMDMITFYLGAGASATAIKGGKSVDTSMGFTPLEGLMMSTRSGDVSAGIIVYLLKNGWTVKELERTLNYESGLIGVSGESEDFKEVLRRALEEDDPKCRLAVDMYIYRARKYLGFYWINLPELSAVSLTGDVAEEIPYVRKRIFEGLEKFGIEISDERNSQRLSVPDVGFSKLHNSYIEISSDRSRVKVFVIPRSGDLLIARETWMVVAGKNFTNKK